VAPNAGALPRIERRMRRTLLLVACAQLAVVPALAQEPTGRPASLVPLAPLSAPLFPGEPVGGAGDLSPYAAFTPLRLSLLSIHPPRADLFFGDGGCGARMEASGNTVNGFAVQRQTFMALTPRLVLHGFSQAGCAFDAGIGGGVTYAVPLAPNLWLVASAGMYAMPAFNSTKPTTAFDARLDVVKRTGANTMRVGLGTRGVSFGGDW
jgi:hypothetical protein